MANNYDVIVIGSGAAGACAAFEMTAKGMKVLMLEKGSDRKLDDFMEGGVYGNSFTSRGRGDELKYVKEHYLMPQRGKETRELEYFDVTGGDPKKSGHTNYGWMSQLVGGGTVHYGGSSFRFDKTDFEMTQFSNIAIELEKKHNVPKERKISLTDWPVEHDVMSEWYARAEKEIGIAGASDSGLPPLPLNGAGRQIQEALINSPNTANLITAPMAINSGSHHGRDSCHFSGLCQDYACRFEAKSDMRVTLIRRALATGNLTIQADTFVRKIDYVGRTATKLEAVVGNPDGAHEIQIIDTPILVIGCEAMETNRLMLSSEIGNNEVVGKYIMFHMTGGARSIAPNKTNTWSLPPHTAFIDSFYNDYSHSDFPFLKTGILLVSSNGGPLQAASRVWGESGRRYLNEVYPYKMDLSYIGDCMPIMSNRIELKGNDARYGCSGTKITYQPHIFDHNAAIHIASKAKEILSLAGGITEDNTNDPFLKGVLGKQPTAHRMFHGCGGCRMGENPDTSVVDQNCKVHGMDNIYITDSSIFPTSGGRNPTLTIQANAMRVGNYIAENHK